MEIVQGVCYTGSISKSEELPIEKLKAELIEKVRKLPNEECRRIICRLNLK